MVLMRKSGLRWRFPLFLSVVAVLLILSIRGDNPVSGQNWGLLSAEMVAVALAFLYWGFEKSTASSHEIAVIAVLGATAAVGRVPFAALPNVQPTTFIVIISGFVFGPRAGFMTGSTAAIVANFFLGQGPWTPWQMFSWGLAGATAGLLKSLYPRIGRRAMVIFHIAWGYLFGWIMNLWFWTAFIYPLNWQSFLAAYAASFWFDTFHALGNAVFYLLFGAGFTRILTRFRRKLEASYLPETPAQQKNTAQGDM